MQVPPHALSQQTPSTQSPLAHSLPPPHVAPIALRHSLPVLFVHMPSVLHTWGVVPTHWRRPGTHWPPQTPSPRQTNSQVCEATHRPPLLQVSTELPLQRLRLGMQSPVQAPFEQMAVQDGMLCHRPLWSHTCGIRLRHCFAFGLQSPVHSPAPLQTYWQAAPGSQVPMALQVSGMLLAPHRLAPGMQTPPQLPLEQTFGHTVPSTQAPFSSQVWVVRLLGPLHRFDPGLHMPVHWPMPLQTFGQDMASGTHSPWALQVSGV
jgi:hypothetical protein